MSAPPERREVMAIGAKLSSQRSMARTGILSCVSFFPDAMPPIFCLCSSLNIANMKGVVRGLHYTNQTLASWSKWWLKSNVPTS